MVDPSILTCILLRVLIIKTFKYGAFNVWFDLEEKCQSEVKCNSIRFQVPSTARYHVCRPTVSCDLITIALRSLPGPMCV